jgi:hypothetical protein
VIIDDILLFSSDLPTVLNYLNCICQIFVKYQVSLKLPKRDFLKRRFEYVGHDITADGNCPAESPNSTSSPTGSYRPIVRVSALLHQSL